MGTYAVPGGEHGSAIVAPAFSFPGFAAVTASLPANALKRLECTAMVGNLAIYSIRAHRFAPARTAVM